MSFSIVAFLVSIGGMISASVAKYRWPIVIFGIMLTVVTFVFIIFGFSLATLSKTSETDIREFCENKTRNSSNDSKFRSYIYDIDMDINVVVNKNMCRLDVCPCSTTYEPYWVNVSEDRLNTFKRTKESTTVTEDGDYPLYFCSDCEYFDTFNDCY